MPRRVRELQNLTIDEVSLVDKGANQYATVTIAKRDSGEEEMDEYYNEDGELVDLDLLEEGDVVFDEEGNAFQYEDEDEEEMELVGKAAIPAFVRRGAGSVRTAAEKTGKGARKFGGRVASGARGAGTRVASGARSAGGAAAGAAGRAGRATADAARGARDSAQYGARVAGAHASGAWNGLGTGTKIGIGAGGGALVGAGGVAGYNKVKKSYSEEISKALSDAITDTERDEVISKALGNMEYLEEVAKAAEEAAENERQIRLDAEYTEVAKSYNVGVDPYELGPVLKRAAEYLSYEDCEVIAKALDSASEAVELLDEIGNPGLGHNSDVMSSVDAFLDSNVSKGNWTNEEMVSKVFEENPYAYDEYLAERQGR